MGKSSDYIVVFTKRDREYLLQKGLQEITTGLKEGHYAFRDDGKIGNDLKFSKMKHHKMSTWFF